MIEYSLGLSLKFQLLSTSKKSFLFCMFAFITEIIFHQYFFLNSNLLLYFHPFPPWSYMSSCSSSSSLNLLIPVESLPPDVSPCCICGFIPSFPITKLHEFLVTQRHADHLIGAMRHFLLWCNPAWRPEIHSAIRSDLFDGLVGGAGMAGDSPGPQNQMFTGEHAREWDAAFQWRRWKGKNPWYRLIFITILHQRSQEDCRSRVNLSNTTPPNTPFLQVGRICTWTESGQSLIPSGWSSEILDSHF